MSREPVEGMGGDESREIQAKAKDEGNAAKVSEEATPAGASKAGAGMAGPRSPVEEAEEKEAEDEESEFDRPEPQGCVETFVVPISQKEKGDAELESPDSEEEFRTELQEWRLALVAEGEAGAVTGGKRHIPLDILLELMPSPWELYEASDGRYFLYDPQRRVPEEDVWKILREAVAVQQLPAYDVSTEMSQPSMWAQGDAEVARADRKWQDVRQAGGDAIRPARGDAKAKMLAVRTGAVGKWQCTRQAGEATREKTLAVNRALREEVQQLLALHVEREEAQEEAADRSQLELQDQQRLLVVDVGADSKGGEARGDARAVLEQEETSGETEGSQLEQQDLQHTLAPNATAVAEPQEVRPVQGAAVAGEAGVSTDVGAVSEEQPFINAFPPAPVTAGTKEAQVRRRLAAESGKAAGRYRRPHVPIEEVRELVRERWKVWEACDGTYFLEDEYGTYKTDWWEELQDDDLEAEMTSAHEMSSTPEPPKANVGHGTSNATAGHPPPEVAACCARKGSSVHPLERQEQKLRPITGLLHKVFRDGRARLAVADRMRRVGVFNEAQLKDMLRLRGELSLGQKLRDRRLKPLSLSTEKALRSSPWAASA
mmetsp:Transcript_31582/g.73243  ORF Transcript_31582/g.73243 Transcript_31582/m.73243 type:complete len:601 (+) Transcript_31582:171-1973(+)